jgi:hypothetical protein
VLSAETFRGNGDADADWKAPFGPRDQLGADYQESCSSFVLRYNYTVAIDAVSSRLAPGAPAPFARPMCGRAHLSSDVSEIKLVFSIRRVGRRRISRPVGTSRQPIHRRRWRVGRREPGVTGSADG